MDKNLLMLGGAAIAAYFLFFREDTSAPAVSNATGSGSNTTGGNTTGGAGTSGNAATGGNAGTGTGTGTNNNTTGTPALTLAQKLNEKNSYADKLATADEWNYWYKEILGTAVDQPDPVSYLPSGTEREARFNAASYMAMRGLSGLGDAGGLGVIFKRRNF